VRRQKCSQCGTVLDVTKLEKGAKFACANCGSILVVGETAAVKRSLKEGGPAFKPRAKKEAEDAPAPARRRRAAAERAPRERAPKKGPLVPVLIVVGLLVVGAGAAAFLMGDSGGGAGPGGGSAGGAEAWWADRQARLADADAETLRSWLREAKAKGYDRDAAFWGPRSDRIYQALLRKAPADPVANERTGKKNLRDYPEFDQVWEAMNEDFRALSKTQKDFLDGFAPQVDAKGKPPIFLDDDEYASAKAVLDDYVAWRKRQAENPAAPKIAKAIGDASAILGRGHGFVAASEGPFIVLVSYEKGQGEEEVRKEFSDDARKYAKALLAMKGAFEERIAKPLDLPAIEPGFFFYHLAVTNRDDLERFVLRGQGRPDGIPAHFSSRTKWSHAWLDDENARRVLPDLARGGVQQLRWYYSKDAKKKWLNHFEEWGGLWFTEGLAEYLGAGIEYDASSGGAKWTGIAERRVEHLQRNRNAGYPLFPLRDIVQVKTFPTLLRVINVNFADLPDTAKQLRAAEGARLDFQTFLAQCWALAHFLDQFGNGKYRPAFHALVKSALSGRAKPDGSGKFKSAYDAFVEIVGVKDDAAWTRLQKEYSDHIPRILRRS